MTQEKMSGRKTVGGAPYVFCPNCGDANTAWARPIMQRDGITYRSRQCVRSCRSLYRVAILIVDNNPTALNILSAYHDAVEAGSSTEVTWEEA